MYCKHLYLLSYDNDFPSDMIAYFDDVINITWIMWKKSCNCSNVSNISFFTFHNIHTHSGLSRMTCDFTSPSSLTGRTLKAVKTNINVNIWNIFVLSIFGCCWGLKIAPIYTLLYFCPFLIGWNLTTTIGAVWRWLSNEKRRDFGVKSPLNVTNVEFVLLVRNDSETALIYLGFKQRLR